MGRRAAWDCLDFTGMAAGRSLAPAGVAGPSATAMTIAMRIDAKVLEGVQLRWLKPVMWLTAACIVGGLIAGFADQRMPALVLFLAGLVLFLIVHVLTGVFGRCGLCGGRVRFVNLPIAPDQVEHFKAQPRQMKHLPYTSRSTGWYATGYRCRKCTTLGIISLESRSHSSGDT